MLAVTQGALLSLALRHTMKGQHKIQAATKLGRLSLCLPGWPPGSAAEQRGVTYINLHISLKVLRAQSFSFSKLSYFLVAWDLLAAMTTVLRWKWCLKPCVPGCTDQGSEGRHKCRCADPGCAVWQTCPLTSSPCCCLSGSSWSVFL